LIVNLTLSVDDEILREARKTADRPGSSVNQLVREYLEQLAGNTDAGREAAEFEQLSLAAGGDSQGWKFNREELHERH
jgi:hypothetical protein